jgi:hypothetical protein
MVPRTQTTPQAYSHIISATCDTTALEAAAHIHTDAKGITRSNIHLAREQALKGNNIEPTEHCLTNVNARKRNPDSLLQIFIKLPGGNQMTADVEAQSTIRDKVTDLGLENMLHPQLLIDGKPANISSTWGEAGTEDDSQFVISCSLRGGGSEAQQHSPKNPEKVNGIKNTSVPHASCATRGPSPSSSQIQIFIERSGKRTQLIEAYKEEKISLTLTKLGVPNRHQDKCFLILDGQRTNNNLTWGGAGANKDSQLTITGTGLPGGAGTTTSSGADKGTRNFNTTKDSSSAITKRRTRNPKPQYIDEVIQKTTPKFARCSRTPQGGYSFPALLVGNEPG